MAQNIELLNAQYQDVPGVLLPKTGGGVALFTDVTPTTATQSDVNSGKVFFDSSGNQLVGTARNVEVVQGSFVASSSSGSHSVSIPYNGTGYPIEVVVCIAEGMFNNTSGGNTSWYNLVKRYAIGCVFISKNEFNTAPDYSSSGTNNYAQIVSRYKNLADSATSVASGGTNAQVFSTTNPSASSTAVIRFSGNKTMKYFTAASSYGLWGGATYDYIIRYRSS